MRFPLVVSMIIFSGAAAAVPINLYNSAVDGSGSVLADGSVDPHFVILETVTSAYVVNNPHSTWIANDSNSKWIWQDANARLTTKVTRTFRTTFDLTGFDLSTVSISGRWAVDNYGEKILINDQIAVEITDTGSWNYRSWHEFTIDSGFVDGINTLDFVATDTGYIGGFRVEMSGSGDRRASGSVPEPATLSLMGLGLTAIGFARKKKA